MPSDVDPEIVLQDLYFLDRVVRPFAGPAGDDYRIPYLVEALESRRFFTSAEANWEAIELFDASDLARAAFGDDVHHHLLHTARQERAAFDRVVTDWERQRNFERI